MAFNIQPQNKVVYNPLPHDMRATVGASWTTVKQEQTMREGGGGVGGGGSGGKKMKIIIPKS